MAGVKPGGPFRVPGWREFVLACGSRNRDARRREFRLQLTMPMPTRMRQLFAKGFVVFTLLVGFVTAHALDLKNAVIVTPPNLFGSEKKAVQMLIEEVAKRTELHLPMMTVWPLSNAPVIAVGHP